MLSLFIRICCKLILATHNPDKVTHADKLQRDVFVIYDYCNKKGIYISNNLYVHLGRFSIVYFFVCLFFEIGWLLSRPKMVLVSFVLLLWKKYISWKSFILWYMLLKCFFIIIILLDVQMTNRCWLSISRRIYRKFKKFNSEVNKVT